MIELTYETLLDKSVVTVHLLSKAHRVIRMYGTAEMVSLVYNDGTEKFLGKKLREVEI